MQLKRRSFANPKTREDSHIRSVGHLAWVRGHSCLIEGKAGHFCEGKIEAAHGRLGSHAGMGQKPGDDTCIPLCSAAHHEAHQHGDASFQRKYGFDWLKVAAEAWARSPHRHKWEAAHGKMA